MCATPPSAGRPRGLPASDHHDVVVVDAPGKIVEDFPFDDTAEGWQRLVKILSGYPSPAVAIETSSGATVERLLGAGYAVYPVNPKAAKRYRERKAPSGTQTDRLDAWSLADALRLDGHMWRVLKADDPLTVELRLLCRDEIGLIEQRTALIYTGASVQAGRLCAAIPQVGTEVLKVAEFASVSLSLRAFVPSRLGACPLACARGSD